MSGGDMSRDAAGGLQLKLKHYRLSQGEYELIKKYLGHEPNDIEWALYSALWSEHCSYKSSKVHLKKLFTKHPRVVQGPGENAGVIDLGQGERVAFKMESHNHPSFIEPTQGAATGVGGILRDIFTMGARPIASMDYLCFGEVDNALTPKLVRGVVNGVGGYGNCVGVPTVSGQTTFHKSYNNNNLVNAFNLGLFRPQDEVFYGRAEGEGNLIVYAGARTGRDGIHGAAMASESFDEDSEKKKPNVQIGDPFLEKLLIEACLEVMKHKLVVGIQDMGAAGLTSSTFEMAARAKSGLRMDLKRVPLREPDITPEEILLSESQERMILIVKPSNFSAVEEIFKRWDLQCAVIGEITSGDDVELCWGDQVLARLKHEPLVEKAPVYERPFELPEKRGATPIEVSNPKNFNEAFQKFLSKTEIASRRWVTRQYDQRVGARTISACEDSVALVRLPDSGRVLGMATGCRPLLMEWDVAVGSADAIALPVLQMAAKGVRALACTDCLNFGNPEKKNIMGQFVASLRSLNDACLAFDVPIISGNVSLYNETLGENIVPTPATGIVGIRESERGPSGFLTAENLELWLVSIADETHWLGEYAASVNVAPQGAPQVNLKRLVKLQEAFLEMASFGAASRVVARGGLVTSLARMVAPENQNVGLNAGLDIGVDVQFDDGSGKVESYFAERFYSAIWAFKPADVEKMKKVSSKFSSDVKLAKIGVSKKGVFKINGDIQLTPQEIQKYYARGLEKIVERLS